MPPGLETLSPELFLLVIKELSKWDLKALSRVSKRWYPVVIQAFWESVTVEPWTEYNLQRFNVAAFPPRALYQHTRHLHFRSEFQSVTEGRCPHHEKGDDPYECYTDDEYDTLDGLGSMDDEDIAELSRFDCLSMKMQKLLDSVGHGQLHSFSWDLGTCIPSGVLGPRGSVPLFHPLLRSLALTTHPVCYEDQSDAECEIDLSPLRHLQSLRWRAVDACHLSTLSLAIENNSERLQSLELDFLNWYNFQDELGYGDDQDEEAKEVVCRKVFSLTRQLSQPIFPNIRKLSLTEVPLVAAMAHAINFDTLRSLTLRKCPGWHGFLTRVMILRLPIRLKTLEIQDSDLDEGTRPDRSHAGYVAMHDFVSRFEGLEELSISHFGPEATLEFWNHVAHHQATLKRFVHHQGRLIAMTTLHNGRQQWKKEHDLSDLGIPPQELQRIKEDPSRNPLACLDLDFIGLSCAPEWLEYILLPFAAKQSLKVIHIRQTGTDLTQNSSLAWMDYSINRVLNTAPSNTESPARGVSTASGSTSSEIQSPASETDDWDSDDPFFPRPPMLRLEFYQFAEWAFGPQGVKSLQLLVFGDLAHGSRKKQEAQTLYLCRSTNKWGTNFRRSNMYGLDHKPFYEYLDALQACPVAPLLGR